MARAAREVVPVMAQDGSPRKGRKAATAAPSSAAAGAPALVGAAAVKARADAAFSAARALKDDAERAARAAMDALRFTGDGVRGLTFERRWTRPGVHPYDEIAWEIRTAAIGNESGKLVFEQKDVEVPAFWSQLATNVVVSKYFRGHLGTPERETSVRQLIDRVVHSIAAWAEAQHYFATDHDLDTFSAELTHLLVHQKMSFNSPVWFNVGIEARPQCSACFINSVQDSMTSIMDLAKTEAMLFKFGSGAGSNLSTIRSSREKMAGGGTASGPVSFMRGYDSFASVVKSGGKTRRAAKMVILDVGHPDILDFIDSKKLEEKKAWALIEEGYDPSFTGEAYGSVSFQNANHSVRVTDDFMRAVEADGDWTTHAVVGGAPMGTHKARDIFRRMADAAHLCGDPGIQYDTTINAWNPVSASDRQYATNPCVTGDTLVATDEGWRSIESLVGERANIIGSDGAPHPVDRIFPTGTRPVFEMKTRAGYRVRITADHKVATQRGDVAVRDLTPDDRVPLQGAGFGRSSIAPRLAEAIGLAVGDGCLAWVSAEHSERPMIVLTMHRDEAAVLDAVAGEINEQKHLLKAVGSIGRNDGVHVSFGATGSRLAFSSRPVVEQLMQYAVLDEGSHEKRLKPAVHGLDRASLAGVLRGLFTADGTVVDSGDKSQYVGLDSTSLELLIQVQRLLLAFGVKAKLYENRRGGLFEAMLPDGRGAMKTYPVREMHSLRITRSSRRSFEREIGFMAESPKAAALAALNATIGVYREDMTDPVASVTPLGEEDVFDLTERATSHFVANGLVVHNCSEFSFLNDTSCNLASLNLMKFVGEDGELDVDAFRYGCRLTITAQEILVDNASYPTPKIEENSHRFRPLGLGYANLGALLMSRGLAYDSPAGQAYAGAITSVMTAEAYRQSAVVARDHGGPFLEFERNRVPFMNVIGMHRDAARRIPAEGVPAGLGAAARSLWDEAYELGERHGYRNAQTTLLAPTGTISFMLDCDTTGIEPDIALVKYKKLVGEGYLKIVNNTVPGALRRLGYTPDQVEEIVAYVDERETIEGAPGLEPEHLTVFDCAFKPRNGVRSILPMGHVRMMAAVQPFLSGAISKTVNMPEAATADEIEQIYVQGWKLGLKAIAIYRDNSKRSQPLSTSKLKSDDETKAASEAVEELRRKLATAQVEALKPHRRRLPAERAALTHKFDITGHEGYITVGLYPDGQPGEIFLKMAKEGSTVSGLMDTFATAISLSLQYGVPLRDLVNKFSHVRFEPSGFTGNPEIPIAKSVIDYIFRWLGSRFLVGDDKAALGLLDRGSAVGAAPFAVGGALAPQPEEGPSAIDEAKEPPATTATATAVAPSRADPPTASAKADVPAVEARNGRANGNGNGKSTVASALAASLGADRAAFKIQEDAPSCADCGSIMVRNGSCYKCLNCGSTSGCS
jgi:ribonucleoside-diphosphate reductase alpha chain